MRYPQELWFSFGKIFSKKPKTPSRHFREVLKLDWEDIQHELNTGMDRYAPGVDLKTRQVVLQLVKFVIEGKI